VNARAALVRSLAAIGVTTGLLGLAPAASAEVTTLRAIPTATFPGPLPGTGAPASITASEHVEGFHPAAPPEAQRAKTAPRGRTPVWVFAREADARSYATRGRIAETLGKTPEDVCLAPDHGVQLTLGVPLDVRPARVQALRAEILRRGPKGVALETVDVWVDTFTLGVRLIGRTLTELAEVAKGPGGITVHAARDGQEVTFLVTGSAYDAKGAPWSTAARAIWRVSAELPGSGSESCNCGRLRVKLEVAPGRGQTATVFTTALLPPVARDDDKPDAPPVRTRPIAASLSVSQLVSDKEPIVTVDFAWAGKDQLLRF
jgi:hypothetical protein